MRLFNLVRSAGMEDGSDLLLELIYLRSPGTGNHKNHSWSMLRNSVAHGRSKPEALVADALNERLPDWFPSERRVAGSGTGLIESVVLELDQWPWASLPEGETQPIASSLFESVLRIRAERLGRKAADSTPSQVARLMAQLCVAPDSDVLDPACGDGALLMASETAGSSHLQGWDISSTALARSAMRLDLAGLNIELSEIDALNEGGGPSQADCVLVHPPFGQHLPVEWTTNAIARYGVPPKSKGDLAWVQLALSQLRLDGSAAVLLPVGPLFRGGAEAEIRRRLIEAGTVEAIVALPSGLFHNTKIKSAIWVLRSPSGPRDEPILMMSAADFAVRKRQAAVISDEGVETLSEIMHDWRFKATLRVSGSVAKAVPISALSSDVRLVPEPFLDTSEDATIERPQPPSRLIEQLRIENVKAFDGAHAIDLAPITLLYGPNSSGKSSVLQSILLLKQSVKDNRFVTQGDLTDAGSFEGLVHKHELDRHIGVGLTFGSIEEWGLEGAVPNPSLYRSVDFEFSSQSNDLTQQRVTFSAGLTECEFIGANIEVPSSLTPFYEAPLSKLESLFEAVADSGFVFPSPASHDPDDAESRERRREGRRRNAVRTKRTLEEAGMNEIYVDSDGLLPTATFDSTDLDKFFSGRDDREHGIATSNVHKSLELVAGMGNELRTLLTQTSYLGPLRSAPKRFYNRAAMASGQGTAGENVALHLFDHSSEAEAVNEWLERLAVPYQVRVRPVQAVGGSAVIGDTVAMTLTDTRSGVEVSPTDVGFGVSQVLPIVVQLLALSDSVVCIEQPEIHLHPRVQTYLADLLIESASSSGGQNQIIAETHSEHLLLRLQRRIREGDLSHEDVSIIYVDQNDQGSAHAQRLMMDEQGFFVDAWPAGFFDDSLDEIFGS